MFTKRILGAALVAVLAMVATASTVAAAPDKPQPAPLLRIHAALKVQASGILFEDLDSFVFDDGTVTGFVAFNRDATCSGCPWSGGIVAGSGTAAQFKVLRRALMANTVGLQRGDCQVESGGSVGWGSFEVTWYGRNARRNDFVVRVDLDGPKCPAQVANLLTAIEAYERQAGVPESNLLPFH